MPDPLSSPEAYQAFVYGLREQFPSIRSSTLVYIPSGDSFGRLEGMLVFEQNTILCVQEYLNFELGVIEGYGYEVSSTTGISPEEASFPATPQYCKASYPLKKKLYWYDSFPHPSDLALAATNPHHKHIHPDIKRHRIPAPGLSFTKPNLPFLIWEIEQLLAS